MTHEEAFLQAIIEAPDDDAPRLVYADWLEEHGQPERAAFIRVQCELARMPEGNPSRAELTERERALLAEHGRAWAEALNLQPQEVIFRRGFVEEAAIEAHPLLAGAGPFAKTPLRDLMVQGYEGNQLGAAGARALASWLQLARLEALRLPENDLFDEGVIALAASPYLANLRVLDLGNNQISEEGMAALAGSPHLAGLRELYLDYNYIGVAGARALAR
jgi:uncharacterized protein (TIGR02996 family)